MDNRNTKTYILFQPKHLLTKRPVLEIRQWIKTPTGVTSGEQPLTRQQLKISFPSVSDEGFKAILAFSKPELLKVEAALHNQSAYHSNEAERSAMQKKAMVRYLQSLLMSLRQQNKTVELYHQVNGASASSVQTVKCISYAYPVELAFHVIIDDSQYLLDIYVVRGKERMHYNEFKRVHFLLEADSCYYQLSSKIYEAAE